MRIGCTDPVMGFNFAIGFPNFKVDNPFEIRVVGGNILDMVPFHDSNWDRIVSEKPIFFLHFAAFENVNQVNRKDLNAASSTISIFFGGHISIDLRCWLI